MVQEKKLKKQLLNRLINFLYLYMEYIKMDRSVVSKSSFEEADDHVTFYEDKTPLERLSFACDIINSIFDTNPEMKVDRTVFSSRKHAELI